MTQRSTLKGVGVTLKPRMMELARVAGLTQTGVLTLLLAMGVLGPLILILGL
jgi:hypothetical protein